MADYTDIDKLRELAEAATPGPWATVRRRTADAWDPYRPDAEMVSAGGKNLARVSTGPNAEFIAACSPDVILALVAELVGLRTEVDQLRTENAQLTRERDLAIAHDTQPYPTAWAYEQACRVMHEAKAERDALQAEVERLRRGKRAAEFWDRLVQMVVARPEWRAFYEADGRGACDEVMIDYLAALQARIDAATELLTYLDANDPTAEVRVIRRRLVAALGVDAQKETQQ